jgi:hypothetical protein
MSFTPDGMVHYFASPGVAELTMDDHITSQRRGSPRRGASRAPVCGRTG